MGSFVAAAGADAVVACAEGTFADVTGLANLPVPIPPP